MSARLAACGALFLLAGCATAPPAPDTSIDPLGRWTIAAVDGAPTGGGRRFELDLNPSFGSAQFGCNTGSGNYRIADGWFVPDDWIITAADCPNRQRWLRFERKGFEILGKPAGIERLSGGGIRLRNQTGSIDLVPASPVQRGEILGTWTVDRINSVATPGNELFRITFGERDMDARFGCNRYNAAAYRVEAGRLHAGGSNTEIGCEPAVMAVEEQAFAILRAGPELVLRPGDRLMLVSARGTIELSRTSRSR